MRMLWMIAMLCMLQPLIANVAFGRALEGY
jgi:hypothetical protein